MNVHKAAAGQIPAVKALWHTVFGDTPAETDRIYSALALDTHCLTLEESGAPAAAAHWYDGGTLVLPDGRRSPAGVLYAVACAPEKRGQGCGAAVSEAAWADMAAAGCGVRLTVPAGAGLFAYYRRTVQAETALYVRELTLDAKDCGARPRRVEAEEYGLFRRAFLRGRMHLAPTDAALRLQQAVCEHSGGGLFAFAGGCFTLELTAQGALVSELLCANSFVGLACVSSAAAGRTVTVRMPVQDMAEDGVRPFAMADRPEIVTNSEGKPAWFGFAFD